MSGRRARERRAAATPEDFREHLCGVPVYTKGGRIFDQATHHRHTCNPSDRAAGCADQPYVRKLTAAASAGAIPTVPGALGILSVSLAGRE